MASERLGLVFSILFFPVRLTHVVVFKGNVLVVGCVAFLSDFAAQMMFIFTLRCTYRGIRK